MSIFGKTKPKILIAEDDPALRKVLYQKLQATGYNVVDASDGEMALNIAIQEKPELIILDQLMPKLTGAMVAKQLREDTQWGKTVPIFILTNIDEGTNTHAQIKDLANRYFVKSDTPLETIINAIQESLSQTQDNQAN